jgi:ribosomal protein L32
MAEQILGAAKNPDEVVASLNQIRGAVGQRFTDQVGAIAQTSDIWRSWHQAAPESDTTPASQDALANTRLTSKAAPPASAGYVPVPGSPAALAVEQRKKSAAEAQARRSHEAETRAASEKAAATLGEAVRRQLSARDPAERARIARQIQASGEFSRLDRSTQELVFRAVNGR